MSRVALILVVPVLFACSKKETPAADTAAAVVETPAPATASVAGKWAFVVMPEGKDTVLTTYTLDATNDMTGWKLTFPGRDPLDVRVLSMDSDSIVTETGPYPSAIQNGVKVNLVHTNIHMDGVKLVGTAIAHYDKKTADSVVTLRQEGTRQ
jgi:hypothetical protein